MEQNTPNTQPGLFEKGGKLGWLHSTWDAFDTFLRVPATVTAKGAHVRDSVDLKRIMIIVVLALVPAALFGMWNVGYQHNLATGAATGFWGTFFFGFLKVLPLYIVSYLVGLGIEFTFAQIRGEEVNEGYLVTGMIIPLIVPADLPLWMLALAVAFSVVFAKEVFGGTGMNFLNPALVARAFLFVSYPSSMSGSSVWVSKTWVGALKDVDAVSAATPLAIAHDGGLAALEAKYSFMDMFYGFIPGSTGETSVIAILIGA
ncbi:MAG: RnfABCDGE type electron transport complex subunit D, partial [Bacteroidales bacterium]|nr:RnfABCDGE type electron transport complex subunit D [Bacteroidales bacterium]